MLVGRVVRSGLALLLVAVAFTGAPGGAIAGSALGTLSILTGTATVTGTAGIGPAVDGQTLDVGDQIETSPDGVVLVTFFDGSETQLQPDTHVTLEVRAGGAPGAGVSVFQSAGTTVNHVHHLAPNASFQTDTPTAVAMVRGTTYVVTTMPEAEAAVAQDGTSVWGPSAPTPPSAADTSAADAAPSPTDAAPTPAVSVAADQPAADAAAADSSTDDQAEQQAALIAALPLLEDGSAIPSHMCERGKPMECVASVVLLADDDGHVGHVEVASHISGHPTLHLTRHGDAAHISRAGAVPQVIKAEHVAALAETAHNLHDAQRALAVRQIARHIAGTGLHRQRATPPPAPPKRTP